MKTNRWRYAMVTVSFRRVRGKLRRVYHVRLCPRETDRFPFGLAICPTTLNKARAERYADDVEEYMAGVFERFTEKT